MATQTTKAIRVAKGHTGDVVNVTTLASAGTQSLTGSDSDKSCTKKALVFKFSAINGQEIDVLIRVQADLERTWIDVVASDSIANLSTLVAGMSLTTPGHPSKAKDVVDAQALVAAGGS